MNSAKIKLLTFLHLSITLCILPPPAHTHSILSTWTSTNWGDWQPWELCPEGTFVTAADMVTYKSRQTYNVLLKDELGLVDVILECNDPRHSLPPTFIQTRLNGLSHSVNMSSGPDWTTPIETVTGADPDGNGIGHVHITYGYPLRLQCGEVAVGFQLLFEPEKKNEDNTAANNLRLFCSDLRHSRPTYLEGYGGKKGEWGEPASCGPKQVVCGIQAQANDLDKRETDYTGVNNVRLKCCDVPNPALTCTPTDSDELIQECENIEGVTLSFFCHFKRQVGIGTSSTKDLDLLHDYEFYKNIGYSSPSIDDALGGGLTFGDDGTGQEEEAMSEDFMNYDQDYFWLTSGLAKNFAENLQLGPTTQFDWGSGDRMNIWNAETSESVKFEVEAGYKTQIYQIVGHCSYFSVRTPYFRRVDVL